MRGNISMNMFASSKKIEMTFVMCQLRRPIPASPTPQVRSQKVYLIDINSPDVVEL